MVLALLTLPVVIVATREAIRSIPQEVREGASLGADQWQTVRMYILPAATPGILTGTIIGLARAIGETAPVITIGMLTFIVDRSSPSFRSSISTGCTARRCRSRCSTGSAAAGRVSPERAAAAIRPAWMTLLMNAVRRRSPGPRARDGSAGPPTGRRAQRAAGSAGPARPYDGARRAIGADPAGRRRAATRRSAPEGESQSLVRRLPGAGRFRSRSPSARSPR